MGLKIVINRAGFDAVRQELGLSTDKALADRLEIDKGTVSRALRPGAGVHAAFMASALSHLPRRFDAMFDILSDEEVNAA